MEMDSKANHEQYMRLALALARRAIGRTSPNPLVGAIVVKNRRIVGRGYHRKAGLAHAEVKALKQAGRRARGATLYVTLEPCNHTGRTPPCCDAIISAGIKQVVAAVEDPNPITRGRGLARLKRSGIAVTAGVLASYAKQLNAPFFKVMTSGLPLVVAKVGQSLDGKIATASGQSRWITAEASRRLVHRWRAQADALLVGVNTVLADNPRLTARDPASKRPDRPVKVIVDSHLRTPSSARCLSRQSLAPTWITTTRQASKAAEKRLSHRGAWVMRFKAQQGRVPLKILLRHLAQQGIQSVLIEGGGEILATAFKEHLVDRVAWFVAPILIGGRRSPSSVGGAGIKALNKAVVLKDAKVRLVGPDFLIEAAVAYPK